MCSKTDKVIMSHAIFWKGFLMATRLLWLHSERELQYPYVTEILEFIKRDMAVKLEITSFVQPMLYVMNDMAKPQEDIPKLVDFIETHLIDWNNSSLIKAYSDHVKDLMDEYMKNCHS